jgi:DNA-binding transcriptional LysR family regulator
VASAGAGHCNPPVSVGLAKRQFNPLRERKVELLIGRMPDPFVEDDLVSESLLQEPFVAVAGASSQWARRRRVELADLMGESWVLPPHDSTPGSIIAGLFAASGLKPPRAAIATLSIQLTTTLIATGNFVGILPNSVARFSAGRVGLKILPTKIPATRYSEHDLTPSQSVRSFARGWSQFERAAW